MKNVVGWLAGSLGWGSSGQSQSADGIDSSSSEMRDTDTVASGGGGLDDTVNYEDADVYAAASGSIMESDAPSGRRDWHIPTSSAANYHTRVGSTPAAAKGITAAAKTTTAEPTPLKPTSSSPIFHFQSPATIATASMSHSPLPPSLSPGSPFQSSSLGTTASNPASLTGSRGGRRSDDVAQRLSFGGASLTTTNTYTPTTPFSFGSLPLVPLTPANTATPITHGAKSSFFPSGLTGAANPSHDDPHSHSSDSVLRQAFAAFESRQSDQAVESLEQLSKMSDVQLDALIIALARRTGDSRHLHQAGVSAAGQTEIDGALIGELRNKTQRYESLIQFVCEPLIRVGSGRDQQLRSIWTYLSHSAQSALMQTGELLKCALDLKLLLNSPPGSLYRSSGLGDVIDDTVVSAADQALVTARRQLALECMQSLVNARPDGSALLREGLSPMDIFFSETSRLPTIFQALQQHLVQQETRSVFVTGATGVSHQTLSRINAAAEIVHCILLASATFRSATAHQELFTNISQPIGEELPTTSWLLGIDVRTAIKSLVETSIDTIHNLQSGVSGRSSLSGQTVPTGFNSQVYQTNLFDQLFRIVRVYLQAYTSALSLIAVMKQSGPVHAQVDELDAQIHQEFVLDRSRLLTLLITGSIDINAHNIALTTVFPIPVGGLPGIPEPKYPPYQPVYDLAQEFQDLSHLVHLSLSEPSRHTADRRLVFFIVHYGYPFMVTLFHELLDMKDVARLLELAPVAAVELPNYVREKHSAGEVQYIRDSSGEEVELSLNGSIPSTAGVSVYDAWLAQLLKSYPQYHWLHELYMDQYDEVNKILRSEARAQQEDLSQKKNLLSLSKLALLASSPDQTGLVRGVSDGSHVSESGGESSLTSTVNPNELRVLNDDLSIVNAQEFIHSVQQQSTKRVLPPNELIQQLLQIGLDEQQSVLSSVRVSAFCFAFSILEISFLPRPRTTSYDRFSRENQELFQQIWTAIIQADVNSWLKIVQAKQVDASDSWQLLLRETQLAQVWQELLKAQPPCYGHSSVYTASFLSLLHHHSSTLPASLQSKEVKIVLESALQLIQQQPPTH